MSEDEHYSTSLPTPSMEPLSNPLTSLPFDNYIIEVPNLLSSQLPSLSDLVEKAKQLLRSDLNTLVSEGILHENEVVRLKVLKYCALGHIIRDVHGCVKFHIQSEGRDFFGRTPFELMRNMSPFYVRHVGWNSFYVYRGNQEVSIESLREPFRLKNIHECRKELKNLLKFEGEITIIQARCWKLCFYPSEGKKSFLSRYKLFDDYSYFEVENPRMSAILESSF